MQRYGPPPSYPNLKIRGLNAPIPEVANNHSYKFRILMSMVLIRVAHSVIILVDGENLQLMNRVDHCMEMFLEQTSIVAL